MTVNMISMSSRANRSYWNDQVKKSIKFYRLGTESPHHPDHKWQKRFGLGVIRSKLSHRADYAFLHKTALEEWQDDFDRLICGRKKKEEDK